MNLRMMVVALVCVLGVSCGDDDVARDAGPGLDAATADVSVSMDAAGADVATDVATDDAGVDDVGVSDDTGPAPDGGAPPMGLIFETDFAMDTGYRVEDVGLWNGGGDGAVPRPAGWDAVKVRGVLSVESGEGVGGSNALKIAWDPSASQPTISLAKHLTGDVSTGYDDVYVRYHVRLPNGFRVGNNIPYWKWGRLWQNTSPTDRDTWTENRVDSFYVVWNFGGNVPYTDANITWGANVGDNLENGSNSGARVQVDWFLSGADRSTQAGYFESVGGGAWAFDETDPTALAVREQDWHTIEYHFGLASEVGADDGSCEIWYDGVLQDSFTRMDSRAGAREYAGVPTARHGSGFNFLVFFDNMSGWNQYWDEPGVDGYILVNDVVVSTTHIGHDYVVDGTTL